MHLLHVIWIRNKPEVVVLIRQLSRNSSNWLNDVSPCVTPWDHVFRALAFFFSLFTMEGHACAHSQ